MKKVLEKEFVSFIKNYPRKLESNYFMDWLDYYDFPNSNYKPKDLKDLYLYKVARCYYNPYNSTKEFYIEDKENKE